MQCCNASLFLISETQVQAAQRHANTRALGSAKCQMSSASAQQVALIAKSRSFHEDDELTKESKVDLCQVSVQKEPKEFACRPTHTAVDAALQVGIANI